MIKELFELLGLFIDFMVIRNFVPYLVKNLVDCQIDLFIEFALWGLFIDFRVIRNFVSYLVKNLIDCFIDLFIESALDFSQVACYLR